MAWSIPGSVLLLVALGGWELSRQRRRGRPGTPLSATYVNEFTALFHPTTRLELDQRDSWSLLREDDAQGAPPRSGVDLDAGTVLLPHLHSGSRPG